MTPTEPKSQRLEAVERALRALREACEANSALVEQVTQQRRETEVLRARNAEKELRINELELELHDRRSL
jgi:cell division protein FtsB